jgi:peptide/nickel transport system permease protein
MMSSYIIRRLVQAVPTFLGITFLSYVLILSAPGDPLSLWIFNPNSTPESAAIMRRQLGLDQPILVQYLYWLVGNDWIAMNAGANGIDAVYGARRGLLRGDFGQSLFQYRPVLDLIVERIPATLQLTLSALCIGYILGIPIGVFSAVHHRGWVDQLSRVLSVIGNAVPSFWLGLLLIIIFSVNLHWLPMSGRSPIAPTSDFNLWATISYMIMPVTVLSLGTIATISRFTRTEVLEALGQDYVRTAQAKGLRNRRVWWGHAVRNALVPIATLLGPALGATLGGAVIVEQVFGWPGMGKLVIGAVFQRDYPLVMGSVVIGAVLFMLGVLLADVLYVVLDPRIRLR